MPPRFVHGFSGPYRFLSNFYIEPDGTFVEYEFQRAKCAEWQGRQAFDSLFADGKLTPQKAKAIGRKVKIRDDWEDKKVEIMLFYVQKKFRDHDSLRISLLLTGNAHLEETNWWNDTYWGVCNGKGLNVLGDILMQMRSELPPL